MRIFASYLAIVMALGVGGIMPTPANAVPSYKISERCADASGFTPRAKKHPDSAHHKIFETKQKLAFINRCVVATTDKARVKTHAKRGTIPYSNQYPLMSGDAALWPKMSMAQQRRAKLFLQSGSTIQSSQMGD